ncbi:MAG: S8 family serine peptidase [Acidobacteriia bacterium]|nr:S8 family serine peptidase [Terriglobia bacterium]
MSYSCAFCRRSERSLGAGLLSVFILLASTTLSGQAPKPTDLEYHKFRPKVAPEPMASSALNQATISNGISASVLQQMQALQLEKMSRTPAQQKIDSNVLYTVRMLAGKDAAPGVTSLYTGVDLDASDNLIVDMVANVTDALLSQLNSAGAQVLYTNRALRSIRASIPPQTIENIAASPDVVFISPRQGSSTRQELSGHIRPISGQNTAPTFRKRAEKIRQQLSAVASVAGTVQMGQGSVETEGDITHRTMVARGSFGVDGSPLKIGVLSDGVSHLAQSQATGDLPPTCGTPPCVTVLPGQTGAGDEGTAMMEIIHDMAPGASLYFATADNSIVSFAQNIRDLRAAGCDIIVDDVFYYVESPFQDGQAPSVVSTSQGGVVTQAVNDVVASGALYFSSAGNEGNLDSGTSGTYEGDFTGVAAGAPLPSGKVHNFGGTLYDTITSPGMQVIGLWWADPLGGSSNDYDLYVLNSTGATILAASTNIQTGTQDPSELLGSANVITNNRLTVFQNTGASDRFFHLGLFRGKLAVNTAGETHGHSAASEAYTVAATPASGAFGTGYPTGPYPNPFDASNLVELFTSDGPRQIFFNGDSTAITPGNLSSSGGSILDKPDITAADGVSVTGVGGFGTPFYGTSAAAPAAASVAALVWAAQPTLTPAQMRTVLTSSAVDIMASGFDRDSGNGIVMAWEAINSLGVTGYANPELGNVTANENPGDGNGVIEAGEGAVVVIPLKNTSGVNAATGITATLTTTTANVYVTQPGTSGYASMPAGSNGGNNLSPFTFTLDPAFACGQTIDFALTVSNTGGPQRVLNFTVPTGLLSITNTLGTKPAEVPGVTTATGTQTGRINRNGVISACGTPKAFPGTIAGSHAFDSYTFTACRSACIEVGLSAGSSATNLFTSAYSPSYDSGSIGTNYAGDAGLSTASQTFSVDATAASTYTLVVNDVAGNTTANTYTIQIPACAFSCNVNHLPVAVAHDVSVIAANTGGTAAVNIDNGSSDPDSDAITLTQIPAGPYPVGTTSVILTVVDAKGATDQATANVTVIAPGFSLAATLPSVSTTAGESATDHVTFTPNPGIGADMTLACSGLPAGAHCTFVPATVDGGQRSNRCRRDCGHGSLFGSGPSSADRLRGVASVHRDRSVWLDLRGSGETTASLSGDAVDRPLWCNRVNAGVRRREYACSSKEPHVHSHCDRHFWERDTHDELQPDR